MSDLNNLNQTMGESAKENEAPEKLNETSENLNEAPEVQEPLKNPEAENEDPSELTLEDEDSDEEDYIFDIKDGQAPEHPELQIEEKPKTRLGLGIFLGILIAAVVAGLVIFGIRIYEGATGQQETQGTEVSEVDAMLTGVLTDSVKTKLANVKYMLDDEFLFDIDVDYGTAIIKGYVDALNDPYTCYYNAEEYKSLQETTAGVFEGIGVVVQQLDTGNIVVVRPYESGPAYQAGVRKDDIITKVNGEDVVGQDINLVVSKIKGPSGTTVEVTFYRPSEKQYVTFTIARAPITVETVEHKMLDGKLGYISISSFESNTSEQFTAAFDDLKAKGMKGLIVDLRDNGGGLLDQVVEMADKLLPETMITYTIDKKNQREDFKSDANCDLNVPIVILTNEYTASASEIFTAAMRDNGGATTVGTKTFGKGIVQAVYGFPDGTGLKLTIARYYTPKNICIHEEGIPADVEIPYVKAEDGSDNQLNKAIEVLKSKIK